MLVSGKTTALVETRESNIYDFLAGKPLFGIPAEFYWLLLITGIAWVLLNRHRLGQNAYVIGDNRQAASADGHPQQLHSHPAVHDGGRCRGVCRALLNSLRVVNFYPGTLGSGFFLPALAAVFVGGTSVFGGRGSIYGTFIGAFMMGGIQAGIVAAGSDRLLDRAHLRRDHPDLDLDPRRAPASFRALIAMAVDLPSATAETNWTPSSR